MIQHLLRNNDAAIIGLATASLKLKEWKAALRNVETGLLFRPGNLKNQLVKVKILVECYGVCKSWEGEVMEECFKIIRLLEASDLSEFSEAEREELKNLSKTIDEHPVLTRMLLLKKELISRALDKFSENHHLSNHYASKFDLSKHLKEILLPE